SKAEAERIAFDYRARGLNIVILRPSMVYGPNEPHALKTIVTLLRYRLLPMIGNCLNKIHLTSVDNLVDVMVLALLKKEAYQGSFFVADEEVLTVKEFLSYSAKIIGVKEPFQLPKTLLFFLKPLPMIGPLTSSYTKDRVFSIRRLKEKLGYSPRVSTFDGLKKAVESYR
ncbi:MAG: NAD-dependent epimerase/dehydratase family protein, partial [Candidatus Omnitrophota bacterium]